LGHQTSVNHVNWKLHDYGLLHGQRIQWNRPTYRLIVSNSPAPLYIVDCRVISQADLTAFGRRRTDEIAVAEGRRDLTAAQSAVTVRRR